MAETGNRIVLTDIDIPFWRILVILAKWTVASIPALIIVWLLLAVLGGLVAGIAEFGMHGP